MKALVNAIVEQTDASEEEISQKVEELEGFGVPEDEKNRLLRNKFLPDDTTEEDLRKAMADDTNIALGDIDEGGVSGTVTVEVVELWDSNSDVIDQVGLVGNETGRTKLTRFNDAEGVELEEGETYTLYNVQTDEYNGKYSLLIGREGHIESADADVEVDDTATVETFEGRIVSVAEGTGFIKRCGECDSKMYDNECREHGSSVEAKPALQIKAQLDDGSWVYINGDLAEDILGIKPEHAEAKARDAMDTGVLESDCREAVMLRQVTIEGSRIDAGILADGVEFDELDSESKAAELLA